MLNKNRVFKMFLWHFWRTYIKENKHKTAFLCMSVNQCQLGADTKKPVNKGFKCDVQVTTATPKPLLCSVLNLLLVDDYIHVRFPQMSWSLV